MRYISQREVEMAVRKARAGESVLEIARVLGISRSTFYRWMNEWEEEDECGGEASVGGVSLAEVGAGEGVAGESAGVGGKECRARGKRRGFGVLSGAFKARKGLE